MKIAQIIAVGFLLYIYTGGRVDTSAQNWDSIGLDSLIILHLYISSDTIYAGTVDRNNVPNLNSGLYYSTDNGDNWMQLDSLLGDGAVLGLEKKDNSTLFIIKCPCQEPQAGTLYKTQDNGNSWEEINSVIRWFGISPFNKNEIYALKSGYTESLYKSTDSGESWEEIGIFPSDSHGNRVSIALDLIKDSTLYAAVSTDLIGNYFYKSIDGGNNWFFISSLPTVATEIHGDFYIPDRIYLYSFPQYISNDSGINWYSADSGLSGYSGFISFYQNKLSDSPLYNLRTDGLYSSNRENIFWTRIEGSEYLPLDFPTQVDNLTNIIIDKTANKIYLGTSDGLFRRDVLSTVLEKDNLYNNKFTLEQNYPNPFNAITLIGYELTERNFVQLKIYDQLGREIATPINQVQNAGKYELRFTTEASGLVLSSGVYYYSLRIRARTEVRKMLLLK